MLESNGLVTIAFKRSLFKDGTGKLQVILEKEYDLLEIWVISPYCQIEPSMDFQLGLPVLILREKFDGEAPNFKDKNPLGKYTT